MSTQSWSGRGYYTDFSTSVPAGAVRVRGLPPGSAGSSGPFNVALSSRPAAFAIGPDLGAILTASVTIKRVPYRPALPALELLAA
jgi:hypothetical protein